MRTTLSYKEIGTIFNEFGKTDAIRLQAIATKELLYQKALTLLQDHLELITLIKDKLIQNKTIDHKQWVNITKIHNC